MIPDADLLALAERVCTQAELEAVALEQRGWSQRAIALQLSISREAVRDRLERAARKIAAAMDAES